MAPGGTCAVQQHVTTLPVVPTDQNGSGVAATRRDYFDSYGNLTWSMDERGFLSRMSYDIPNLDRVVTSERYNTSAAGNLIARNETNFDDRGRVYQTIRFAVDPSTGTVGNSLTDNTWFDPSGNVIKSLPAGSDLFTKTDYDGLSRPTTRYTGYDLSETGYPAGVSSALSPLPRLRGRGLESLSVTRVCFARVFFEC